MEVTTFLLQLITILLAARFFGELFAYFKAPPVIGELIAGILIGPSLLGWVEMTTAIHLLAQLGIIMLLFEVGLETDLAKLTRAGNKSLGVALVGIVLPFALGYFVSSYFFEFDLLVSLFIGSILTATSIGITLRVLQDLRMQKSLEAQIITGAAVVDDIIGIILLAMLYEFATSGTVNYYNASQVLLFIVIFILVAPVAAKLFSVIIKKWDQKSVIPGLLPTLMVSLILFFSWIAHGIGAPELLGGFAAGIAMSRQFFLPFGAFLHESEDFSHKVEEQMKPIIHLFTPIFFVSIGLSLNLKLIDWQDPFIWSLTLSLLVAALIGKVASGFALVKESKITQWIVGVAMSPRGEVGLIFANVGLSAKVLSNEVYASIILVIALTTLIAPFVLRYLCEKRKATH